MTVFTVVLMFAFFISFYFPSLQDRVLFSNYNKEVQNLANTVALGVKIAITEENFEGVQTAMDFVKKDPHLKFVTLLQTDSVWNDAHDKYKLETIILNTYPDSVTVDVKAKSNDSIIVKTASFIAPAMSGQVMLGFATDEIIASKRQIRVTSIIVSTIVFIIGIVIGFWLARTISVPVLALRDAANKVGEGDLTQRVESKSRDEIGELGHAFNKMVDDLGKARREVDERSRELLVEKKKTDELLLNILPAETADELKATGLAKAKYYELVTVLFADFVGFTEISEGLQPHQLVADLHHCFSAFDQITGKYGVEKIKTIGDAYMCVAGLPVTNDTHPVDMVEASIEIRDFMDQLNKEREARGESRFDIRIGINSGPVVAGIVGTRKFAYDIWGHTVNIASRMESSSEPGKINISGATYALIKDDFDCTWRGKIKAKGIGEIDMYFINGRAVS
jgi:class 3 adenylate cyclase